MQILDRINNTDDLLGVVYIRKIQDETVSEEDFLYFSYKIAGDIPFECITLFADGKIMFGTIAVAIFSKDVLSDSVTENMLTMKELDSLIGLDCLFIVINGSYYGHIEFYDPSAFETVKGWLHNGK